MRQEQEGGNISAPIKGLNTDVIPSVQPKDSYRFALNAVIETVTGGLGAINNEASNQILKDVLGVCKNIIGCVKVSEDTNCIFALSDVENTLSIFTINSAGSVNSIHFGDNFLNLRLAHPLEIEMRVRRGSERVLYFVDGYNVPRTFNIDRLDDYKTNSVFVKEKFNLIKKVSRTPRFTFDLKNTGELLPGSYNVGISLVDEVENATEVLSVSDTIIVYNDSYTNAYETIQGSTTEKANYYSFGKTNKAISVALTNLDANYTHYRLYLISANSSNGIVNSVAYTDNVPLTQLTFELTGTNTPYQTTLSDIMTESLDISSAEHIQQLENRLVLGNIKGPQRDLYDLQKYASRISSIMVSKTITLNDIQQTNNPKRGTINMEEVGFQPGEIYSFGIVYVDEINNYNSPVYHIPGKSVLDTNGLNYLVPNLLDPDISSTNECTSLTYAQPSIATKDYWGVDSEGTPLTGEKVRHHRFPMRCDLGKKIVEKELISSSATGLKIHTSKVIINGRENSAYTDDFIYIKVKYKNLISGVSDLERSYVFRNPARDGETWIYLEQQIDQVVNDLETEPIYVYSSGGNNPNSGETYFTNSNWERLTENFPVLVGTNSDDNLFGIGDYYIFAANVEYTENKLYNILDDQIGTLRVGQLVEEINGYLPSGGGRITQIEKVGDNLNAVYLDCDIVQTGFPRGDFRVTLVEDVLNDKYKYTTDIFGIKFNNIAIPPGFTGYYIVRQDRTDDQKTVVDSGYMFPLMKDENYTAFAHLNPDSTITRDTDSYALFCADYLFRDEENSGVNIVTEGYYSIDKKRFIEGFVEDAYPGTSYSKERFKKREKDTDGYSLHTLARYAETSFTSDPPLEFLNVTYNFLKPLSSFTTNDTNYYNASADNSVVIATLDTGHEDVDTENKIPYVHLCKDISNPYSDFRSAPFYKEHQRPLTTTSATIYHGDCHVSPLTLTSTTFHDIKLRFRAAKGGWGAIIGGAVLAIVGIIVIIIAEIYSLGSATLAVPVILQGATYLLKKGITQRNLKKAYEEDYERGLKQTIQDEETNTVFGANPSDDEIQYFYDMAENLWIESSLNLAHRVEPNFGPKLFMASPALYTPDKIKTYTIDKISAVDTRNDNGRVYQGFVIPESYEINLDYLRREREKPFIPLSQTYGVDYTKEETFLHRVMWSQQSFQEELVDNYRVFLANDFKDIEGDSGEITSLFKLQNELFFTTKEGLWKLPANFQERVTGDIVSFVGTGDLFSISPRKIIDSDYTSVGCQDKWSIVKTPYGVTIMDINTKSLYLFDGNNLKNLSLQGLSTFFRNKGKVLLRDSLVKKEDYTYNFAKSPFCKFGVGYHTLYDNNLERVLITKKDYSIDESVIDNEDYIIRAEGGKLYYLPDYSATIEEQEALGYEFVTVVRDSLQFKLYDQVDNEYSYSLVTIGSEIASNLIYDNSFTLSYSLKNNSWTSFHSYLPNRYINFKDFFATSIVSSPKIWSHNAVGNFCNYYGNLNSFIVEYVSNQNAIYNKIFDYIKFITEAKKYDVDSEEFFEDRYTTFNEALFYNERQCSGLLTLLPKDVTATSFLEDQVLKNADPSTVTISRNEGDWAINELRDYRSNYTVPFFISKVSDLQNNYFIDKVVNPAAIDFGKSWMDLESFRDKYLIIRLIFNTFADVSLSLKFSIESEKPSLR